MTDLFTNYQDLFEVVQKAAGQPVYLVGGAVRDAMLGRATNDLDFVMKANARGAGKRAANALGGGFYMLDQARDTARVIVRPEGGKRLYLDFAVYRSGDLESDLRDRDFTVNAMAVNLAEPQNLVDPTGGAQDLLARQLRPCSPRSFTIDPVRVLRAVRLSLSLNFRMLPETAEGIRAAASQLERVSPERKRDELFRILEGRQVDTAVRLMDHFGLVKSLLPELEGLKGVTQSPPHVSDVWEHTLKTVDQLEKLFSVLVGDYDADQAANITLSTAVLLLGRYRQQFRAHYENQINPNRSLRALLFLAALYHDTGKPLTRREEAGGRVRFFEHEQVSARIAGERARSLALSTVEIQRLMAIIVGHMRVHHLAATGHEPSRRAVYRFFRAAGLAGVDIILLSLADTLATYGLTLTQERWEEELAVARTLLQGWWEAPEERVRPPRLLDGTDLQKEFGLEPGPKIGHLLESLQEAQADGKVASREDALQFIQEMLQQSDKE